MAIKDKFGFEDIKKSIATVEKYLCIKTDCDIYDKYIHGYFPSFLTYGKFRPGNDHIEDIPYIQKILIAAEAFCNQPVNYYDIISTCRCVYYIQILDYALLMTQKTVNQGDKLIKLKSITNSDEFESLLFELLVCARYIEKMTPSFSEFIKETPISKTPDMKLTIGGEDLFVECKRLNRHSNYSIDVRKSIQEKTKHTIRSLCSHCSLIFDLVMFDEPTNIDDKSLNDAIMMSAQQIGKRIDSIQFSILATKLKKYDGDIFLYPSPMFLFKRYGYEYKFDSLWQGIQAYFYKPSKVVIKEPKKGYNVVDSSWLNGMENDIAIRWRIESKDVIAKYKKISYKRLFEGIEQFGNTMGKTVVHYWYDKDKSIGGRREALMGFGSKLDPAKHSISAIVFSECDFDVSVGGRFDLIENIYYIKKSDFPENMILDSVFSSNFITDAGIWGEGLQLPSIDDI